MKSKLIRITTVPISLAKLLEHQLRFMQQFYEVTAISADPLELEKIGRKEGVKIFSVALTRQITPVKDIKALWKMYKFLKREQPLIVHSHTPKAGTVGMIAAKLAGVPHRLHTVAGLPLLEVTGFKRKLLNFVEKITYQCATKVYPNSNGLKQLIIEQNFCAASKLKVLGKGSSNGIDTAYFNKANFSADQCSILRSELKISPGDFVFIFVGRLVGDKGINELVCAFKQLSAANCKLLLVGPFEQELDALNPETLKEIDDNPRIISVGFKADVRPYFAISDALVFPSYREGFPNVVMQAGAMGLPAIVSNINGCNEIIIEKENGIIIPVKNIAALKEAMNEMMLDEVLKSKLLNNSRKMIVDRYEQKVVWEAILTEYRNLEQDV